MESKVKNDFILLAEFAEIKHGPQPILTVPPKAEGQFDISSFSVRVFSTDFQESSDETFNICPDSQVLLTEPRDRTFAYVHYFALNDIQARGYLRQYCLCYITSSISKLIDNFEALQQEFSTVTALFKCGNHRVFGKDLDYRLGDIEYSRHQLELCNQSPKGIQYDFQIEDIPETNDAVLCKDMNYIKEIMGILSEEMRKDDNMRIHHLLESTRLLQRQQMVPYTTGNSMFFQEKAEPCEEEFYKPKRVMAHVSHRFTRQLRSLDDLSIGSFPLAMAALKDIHKFYSRSELALSMESTELNFVSPVSSMFSAGRVPLCNLMDSKRQCGDCSHLLHSHNYTVSVAVTAAAAADPEEEEGEEEDDDGCISHTTTLCDNGLVANLDTSFVDCDDLMKMPLYLETIPRQRGLSIVDPLASTPVTFSANHRSQSALSHSSYNTPETFPTPPTSPGPMKQPKEEFGEGSYSSGRWSLKDLGDKLQGMAEENASGDKTPTFLTGAESSEEGYHTPVVVSGRGNKTFTFSNPSDFVQIKRGVFPFISSTDLIESVSCNRPGNDLLSCFKDLPDLRDMLYSILIGMPFVIIAHPKEERLVVKHIKALWLFVGGHSSESHVIPWQDTPLTLKQLTHVKLIGLSSNCDIHNNIKGHIAYWDWTQNILSAPKYSGTCLNPILNRTRERKNPDLFLSIILCVLADLALKLFFYYHGYCTQPEDQLCLRKLKPSPEVSAKKLFSVSPAKDKSSFFNSMRIKESDVDIIEHWADVIRRQQLKEWRTHCSMCHLNTRDSHNTIRLKMKYCQEKICKPKRLHNHQ